jgi:cellulose synthase operon protein YhjQ
MSQHPPEQQPARLAGLPISPAQRPAEIVESLSGRGDSSGSQRRPKGYHPDEASGVREIYRGPDYSAPQPEQHIADSMFQPLQGIAGAPNTAQASRSGGSGSGSNGGRPPFTGFGKRRTDPQPRDVRLVEPNEPSPLWQAGGTERSAASFDVAFVSGDPVLGSAGSAYSPQRATGRQPAQSPSSLGTRPVSPFSQPPVLQPQSRPEAPRGRRAQDDFGYQSASGADPSRLSFSDPRRSSYADPPQRIIAEQSVTDSGASRSPYIAEQAGPAWLYAPPADANAPVQSAPLVPPTQQSSVAETLQHSRERVAARWFALKGVFEQPGQETVEPAPVRQKEIRTPVLAVFSLAGGVGKTSLVATMGRALSSLGEKVLLTDTTSHGLLPFYFGASELRQGTVRTFSPPSGSTDAPIYLVSYDIDQRADEAEQQKLVEEIVDSSRGTHRILLDLTVGSAWIVRHMARMSPTILVPVAPDMNSVISLQAIEKFFHGMVDADGRPLQPYYLINQFDASLPLHLDVREVLRRQLGDRLLPFVIHRAPEVSEALAEGMTVVDYAPDSPVSTDYMSVATWLRTIAAPAAAGFRNVRWSER